METREFPNASSPGRIRRQHESHVKFDIIIPVHDMCSLTDFQRHTQAHLKRLKVRGLPKALTLNGLAELIMQDAATGSLLNGYGKAVA